MPGLCSSHGPHGGAARRAQRRLVSVSGPPGVHLRGVPDVDGLRLVTFYLVLLGLPVGIVGLAVALAGRARRGRADV